jgi:hypothetical protein
VISPMLGLPPEKWECEFRGYLVALGDPRVADPEWLAARNEQRAGDTAQAGAQGPMQVSEPAATDVGGGDGLRIARPDEPIWHGFTGDTGTGSRLGLPRFLCFAFSGLRCLEAALAVRPWSPRRWSRAGGGRGTTAPTKGEVRFAHDSPLEGGRFEPSVPLQEEP